MKKLFVSCAALFATVAAIVSLALSLTIPLAASAQTTPFCYTFTRNIGEGHAISTADATALAYVLTDQGLWPSGTPITSYTEQVASAVAGFQEKYAAQVLTPNGLTYGTGYVGTATRAELNTLYGCSTGATTGSTGSGSTSSTSSFQCPTNWTCRPTAQTTFVCPLNWTCTPTTSSTTGTTGDTGTTSTSQTNTTDQTTAIPPTTYTISVAKAGAGSGTVSGGSISCSSMGSTCSQSSIPAGTTLTLTATPATGSSLTSWSGCTSTSGTTCVITVHGNAVIGALFSIGGVNTTVVTTANTNTGNFTSATYATNTPVYVVGDNTTIYGYGGDALSYTPPTGLKGTYKAILSRFVTDTTGTPLKNPCSANQYIDIYGDGTCQTYPTGYTPQTIPLSATGASVNNLVGMNFTSMSRVYTDGSLAPSNLCKSAISLPTAKYMAGLGATGLSDNSKLLVSYLPNNGGSTNGGFASYSIGSGIGANLDVPGMEVAMWYTDGTENTFRWNGQAKGTNYSATTDWSDPQFHALFQNIQLPGSFLYKCTDAGYVSNFPMWASHFASAMKLLRTKGLVQ